MGAARLAGLVAPVGRLVRGSVSLPLGTVAAATTTATALTAASVQTLAGCAATAAAAGAGAASMPVRHGITAMSSIGGSLAQVAGELVGAEPRRRCWRGGNRSWIEIRGLDDRASGQRVAAAVLAAVRSQPGVALARLNYPLSRVIIWVDGDEPTLPDLCAVVSTAEDSTRTASAGTGRQHPSDLPADDVMLAHGVASIAANAAGLGAALVGRALSWPRVPAGLAAVVTVIDYQPRLRRLIEDRLGPRAADTALAAATAAANTLTQVPAPLLVDLLINLAKAAEARSASRAWQLREPALSRHAGCPGPVPRRPRPRPGPVERHADLCGLAQAAGAAAVGVAARSVDTAATAAQVAAPKAARHARESFASTLGRGLADHHGVLALRPEALRRLDRVDTVLIDPRALCIPDRVVRRIRGAAHNERAAVWRWAQANLNGDSPETGWQSVGGPWAPGPDRPTAVEVLVCNAPHPLASAVLAEARSSGAEVVSLDVDTLDDLRSAFDELHPVDGSIDAALAESVQRLQRGGHTIAVLSTVAAQALSTADVAIGLVPRDASPPWQAQLLVDDMAGVWQIMHALPAARRASRRGVEIATAASLLGALLMIPGVRGRGPGPVTAGAGAGLWSGYRLARGALRAAAPPPTPSYEWHAMSIEQVRRALPTPTPVANGDRPARPDATCTPSANAGGRADRMRQALSEFAGAVGSELSDPLTPVLATGAAASAVLGSPIDALLVGSVLVGNAILAATQRMRAERLLRRMLTVQDPPARLVIDDPGGEHHYQSVHAARLRAGEVIEVRPGEVVPADGRLIEAVDLEVDESSLTGESLPVAKQTAATPGAPLAERSCMMYADTTVVAGTGVAIVAAVADQTQARRAARVPVGDETAVGLHTQLRELTKQAWPISLAGGALVSALGLLRHTGLRQAVSSGVAVSVAAVPEGLPIVATLAQQASARRLTRLGALVRTPRAVEALGRVDVVCFDKTGTLSENRLRISKVHPADGFGRARVLACAAQATPPANGGHDHATDAAIRTAARDLPDAAVINAGYLPFRSGRPYSASVHGSQLSIKGAPEVVLGAGAHADPDIVHAVGGMAANGLRVIAVAQRELTPEQAASARQDPEAFGRLCGEGLQIVGLLGLSDTPRPQACGVLAALAERQIGVRMITGDHPVTATAIATELGIPVTAAQVISGAEWEALPRRGQEQAVAERLVFARMSPEHKVQIVQTLQRLGHVCAMVGDGANDAAAIRAATVGIGVAAHGSDPARGAADVMLLDGRIEALVGALDEGRQLWRRVQAAVAVLLGGNAGEVAFAIAGTAITGRSPLNTRQLLLVNMLTDALPAAALAVSPVNGGDRGGGRGPDQAALWRTVTLRGATTAAAATAAWALASVTGRPRRASTVALVALVATQLGQTLLDSRSPLVVSTAIGSLVAMAAVISTPGLSQLLGSTPLGPIGWSQALATAAAATTAAAIAPRIVGAFSTTQRSGKESGAQPETSTTTPPAARNGSGHSGRADAASTPPRSPVNGFAVMPPQLTTPR
jgi:cation-transporting P-type ATPase I